MALNFINKCQYCEQTFSNFHTLTEHMVSEHLGSDPEHITQREGDPSVTNIPNKAGSNATSSDNTDFEAPKIETNEKSKAEEEAFNFIYNCSTSSSASTQLQSTDRAIKDNVVEIKRKTKPKPYICSVCGCTKRFQNINDLKYHWRYGHNSVIAQKTISTKEEDKNNENEELTDVELASSTSQESNSPAESLHGFTSPEYSSTISIISNKGEIIVDTESSSTSPEYTTISDEQEIIAVDSTEFEED